MPSWQHDVGHRCAGKNLTSRSRTIAAILEDGSSFCTLTRFTSSVPECRARASGCVRGQWKEFVASRKSIPNAHFLYTLLCVGRLFLNLKRSGKVPCDEHSRRLEGRQRRPRKQ